MLRFCSQEASAHSLAVSVHADLLARTAVAGLETNSNKPKPSDSTRHSSGIFTGTDHDHPVYPDAREVCAVETSFTRWLLRRLHFCWRPHLMLLQSKKIYHYVLYGNVKTIRIFMRK